MLLEELEAIKNKSDISKKKFEDSLVASKKKLEQELGVIEKKRRAQEETRWSRPLNGYSTTLSPSKLDGYSLSPVKSDYSGEEFTTSSRTEGPTTTTKQDGLSTSKYDGSTPKLDNLTSKVDRLSPQVDRFSPQADRYSTQTDRFSPQLDRPSSQADRFSTKTDRFSPQTENRYSSQFSPGDRFSHKSDLSPYSSPQPGTDKFLERTKLDFSSYK